MPALVCAGKGYGVTFAPCLQASWKLTRNQDLHVLHVHNATTFVDDLDVRVITNDTLVFDFVYFLHPVWLRAQCMRMQH